MDIFEALKLLESFMDRDGNPLFNTKEEVALSILLQRSREVGEL